MKIHMDYLEGKVEEYDNVKVTWDHERKVLAKKIGIMEEKAKERAVEVEKEISMIREDMANKMAEADKLAKA